MNGRVVGGGVLALAVLGAVAGVWWWSRPVPSDVLALSGTIEATEVDASFKIAGRVIARPVDEGDTVAAGALIARLESAEHEAEVARLRAALVATQTRLPQLETEIALRSELTAARVAEAEAALAAREAQLAELRSGSRSQEVQRAEAELREARATMDNARADLERIESLYRKELVAAQARDQARWSFEVAVERHRAAAERLDLVREGPRQEEIRRAEAEVRQARAGLALARTGQLEVTLLRQQLDTARANVARDRAALAAAEAMLGYTTLSSPLAGVVVRKHVEPGEMIPAGTPVVSIADLRHTWLKVYVPEPQLGRVKLGQAATITTDSRPGQAYRGTVTFVSAEAEFTPKTIQTPEERVKLVFAAKIAVDNPDQELKPGMPADARIALR